MEVRRTNNISSSAAGAASKSDPLSPSAVAMSFIFGMFRKKDRDRDKDKEKPFTREEQIMSGIIASDNLIDGISKGVEPKNGR